MIPNPFWNRSERRLRAIWRLLGQALLLILALIPTQIAAAIVAFLIFRGRGPSPMADWSDAARVRAWLAGDPLWMSLATLALALAMLISVWAAARLLDRRRFADLGLHLGRRWWRDLAFGLGLGALLMSLIFLAEWVAGWVTVIGVLATRDPTAAFWPSMIPPLITFIAVGFYEELFSRGYQVTNLAEGLRGVLGGRPRLAAWLATALAAILFGALHLGNPNATWVGAANIAFSGLFTLGLGYLLTGEMGISIGLHISWNLVQGNVFGFPVSGADFSSATLLLTRVTGPALWTGGAFGPEAGLLGLLVTVLGGALIWSWVRWQGGTGCALADLAQYVPRNGRRLDSPSDKV